MFAHGAPPEVDRPEAALHMCVHHLSQLQPATPLLWTVRCCAPQSTAPVPVSSPMLQG